MSHPKGQEAREALKTLLEYLQGTLDTNSRALEDWRDDVAYAVGVLTALASPTVGGGDASLPPLPLPIGQIVGRRTTPHDTDEFWGYFREGFDPVRKEEVYTAEQMRAYALAALTEQGAASGLEDCEPYMREPFRSHYAKPLADQTARCGEGAQPPDGRIERFSDKTSYLESRVRHQRKEIANLRKRHDRLLTFVRECAIGAYSEAEQRTAALKALDASETASGLPHGAPETDDQKEGL